MITMPATIGGHSRANVDSQRKAVAMEPIGFTGASPVRLFNLTCRPSIPLVGIMSSGVVMGERGLSVNRQVGGFSHYRSWPEHSLGRAAGIGVRSGAMEAAE